MSENFIERFLAFRDFGADLADNVYKHIKEECTEYCIKNYGASRETIDLMCQAIIHVLIGIHADMTDQDFCELVDGILGKEAEAREIGE